MSMHRKLLTNSALGRTTRQGDSSVDQVVHHIRQGIINGQYRENTKLLPKLIAERCETSFIPVREALRILESEGFVVFHHNRGAWITSLSLDDLEDLYDLRIDLEGQAVRRARPLIQRDLEHLDDIVDRINIANSRSDSHKVVSLNRDLHFLVYRRSDSPRRLKMIEQLWLHAERYQHMSLEFRDDAGEREHREIIRHLVTGDHNAAAKAMQDHLTSTVNLLRSGFAQVDSSTDSAMHISDD